MAEVFLERLDDRARSLDAAQVEPRLADACARAEAAWPDVPLSRSDFVRHLADRVPADVAVMAALDACCIEDLYLACACAHGVPAALAVLEKQFVTPIAVYLARTAGAPAVDELAQRLRARILVADGAAPPRIAGYTGSGRLFAWVRTAAGRIFTDLCAGERPAAAPGALMLLEAPGADPDMDVLRARYGDTFRQAFAAALATLDSRDATLLKLHFLEGMTIDELAQMYGAAPRSVKRWLLQARERVLAATRRHLTQHLAISTTHLDTILRLAQSQLEPVLDALRDSSDDRRA